MMNNNVKKKVGQNNSEDNFKQIAARIRELREVWELSVEELAAETGVDVNTYNAYENDGVNIPISVLYHLSHKFNVDLEEILTGLSPRLDDMCVVKKGRGLSVDRYPGYSFQSLAPKFTHKIMEPLLVTVEPSDKPLKLVTHSGQEFNMVLQGEIEIVFDKKQITLKEGDSIYFNPMIPHGQKALGGKTARFLTVIAE